jgi:hypothetical protein
MKTLFDHLSAIHTKQRIDYFEFLEDDDRKTYNQFMINRFISMNQNYIEAVNIFQKYLNKVDNRTSYLFYSQLLPKKKEYNKYIKKTTDDKYEPWIVELLAKYFEIRLSDASQYLQVYLQTDKGKEELYQIIRNYGIDDSKTKKLLKS